MSESGQHGYHLSWEQFEPSTCRICTNSPDFLSELNGPVGHPVGVWRNCMLFLETPQMWCQGNPDSLPLCFGSSGESWGQGSNESRALHPEAVTSYQYFQSFWENRIVHQMDCDRAVSCPDPATHMPCVLGKIIWTADTCYMGSLNILPVINTKSLFTFHGRFCSFSTKICSFERILLPTALGWERIFVCQIMIIPLL